MRCMSCKAEEMEKTTTAYFAKLDKCYVIIENVPCYKCTKCGEVFYFHQFFFAKNRPIFYFFGILNV